MVNEVLEDQKDIPSLSMSLPGIFELYLEEGTWKYELRCWEMSYPFNSLVWSFWVFVVLVPGYSGLTCELNRTFLLGLHSIGNN